MKGEITPGEIATQMLALRAITSKDDDRLIHYILRRGDDFADLEYTAQESYLFVVSVGGATQRAYANETEKMGQMWRDWHQREDAG